MDSTPLDMQIFLAIADQIAQVEFQSDSFEFFNKHIDTFEDTDDNKLEYTQVFEAYVYILEKMIEARLSASFDNSAIEEFYANFKDNMAKYEAANKDGFDTLFGFIDFDKFKANILKYKADHK